MSINTAAGRALLGLWALTRSPDAEPQARLMNQGVRITLMGEAGTGGIKEIVISLSQTEIRVILDVLKRPSEIELQNAVARMLPFVSFPLLLLSFSE